MLGVWHFYGTQVDGDGFVKILGSATVTVRRESDAGLAELETDLSGSSPGLDNPFTSGSDGEILFYAEQSERYRIDIVATPFALTLRDQSVSSPPVSSFMTTVLDDPDQQTARATLEAGSDVVEDLYLSQFFSGL